MRTLLTFLIAFTALAVMFAGPFVLLPAVGDIDRALGSGWGGAALAGVFAACAAALWLLSRVADRRTAHIEDATAPGPPDRLFCQACGTSAPPDAVVCQMCASTRFGIRPPASLNPVGPLGPAARIPVHSVPPQRGVMTPDGIGVVSILRHRNFALLWWAQLVSLTGDYFLLIALPFHVYERTGSALATGVMFLAQMAPRVALGSIAGVFVDRWDRRRTMIVADVLRALLLLGLLAVRTQEHLWLIYVIAAAQSAVGAFFTPARSALLPLVVAPGRLVQANALNGLTSSVASLVAPPLGGFVLASFGLHTVVLADSASFLVSAFLVAAMSHRAADGAAGHVATPAVSGGGVWARAWGEWREGIRTVREERPLGALLALNGLVHAGMGITAALFVVFIFQVYGGGPLEVGWWVSAQGAGAIASGLIAARVARATTPRLLIAAALLVRGAILVLQLSIPVLWVGVALASVSMAAGVAYTVSTQSVCQTAAPDRQRGRVFGLLDTTTAAAMMSGMLFGSALGDAVGAVPLFGITAVVWLVASLVAWLTLGGSPEFGRTTVPSLPSRAPRHPWDLGQSRVLRPRPGFAASAV